MIVKAAIGTLKSMSDPELVVTAQTVVTSTTGNPNFAQPMPPLATISTALGAFSVALADAANGGTELTAIKNAKRNELVSLLTQLAAYITLTADGDMAKMLSSGFPYQKPVRNKIGKLAISGTPYLTQGTNSGELIATIPPVRGSGSYNWSLALASAPDKPLQTAQTLGGRATFVGLTPGEEYSLTVNAVGAAGTSDWSDASTLIVI
jgi:hypothetical protein